MKRSRAEGEEGKEGKEAYSEDAQALFNAGKEIIIQDVQKKANSIIAGATKAKKEADSRLKEASSIRAGAGVEKQQWEDEKAALAGVQHFESVVNLNVGGMRYTTSLTTLRRFPDSMIGCMFSGRHALPLGKDEHFFIDRDGRHFYHILNFLRSPEGFKVGLEGRKKEELRRECEYYGIDQLMFGIPYTGTDTYTEKELECYDPIRGSLYRLTALVDSYGVFTLKHKDIDGKIEYCPFCHWGFCRKEGSIYWVFNFDR
ncbi:BTB/POZ protein [Ochromonadaceae sp. CCMP2298]|nr:BTB/POZ protein [Ochromonadaceae sp. CCMP2298]